MNNGAVNALALIGTDLYAGGSFASTMSGINAKYIAKWNGSAWSAIGSGAPYGVYSLAVGGSDLYVGGYSATGLGYIGKWNGSAWSTFGSCTNSKINSLAVLGADLYAGGGFTTAGGSSISYLAKLNDTFTVTFDVNGGSGSISSGAKHVASALTLPDGSGLSRTGYTFSGWNTSANGSGTAYLPGGSYTTNSSALLYAQWTVNKYTVTYNANGGTGNIPFDNKSYFTDLTLSDGSGFARTGYAFTGWNTNAIGSGAIYSGGSLYTVNAPVALYAQWAVTYAVTYNANSGIGTVPVGTKATGINLVLSDGAGYGRTGYTFAGWNTAANGSGTAYAGGGSYSSNSAVTLYAQWTLATYPIVYDPNGGTGTIASVTKTYGVNITLSSGGGLSRAGYTFAGWNSASNGGGTAYAAGSQYAVDAPSTLYAKWSPITYAVTYNANGGTGNIPVDSKISDQSLTLSTGSGFSRTGYALTGWNTLTGGTGTSYATGGSYTGFASVTLYAQWAPTYAVTYNANSGTGTIAAGVKIAGISLNLSDGAGYSRTGYALTGWNTAANGSGTAYAASGSYVSNAPVALYAQWAVTYPVTYNANSGTGTIADAIKITGSTLSLSNGIGFSRTGYSFSGWNTAANGSGTIYAGGAPYTANVAVILYAQWTENTYAVTYSANGGTGTIEPATKSYFTDLSLSNGLGLTWSGYALAGWNTAANGSGTVYTLGAVYSTNVSVTLYAQWVPTYVVTYSANVGIGSIMAGTKITGINLVLSDGTGFTRTGYAFSGWNTVANGSGTAYVASGSYAANAAVTLYAQWTPNSYSITYDPNGGAGVIVAGAKTYNVPLILAGGAGFTWTGYTFTGWNTVANGSGTSYSAGSSFTNEASTTLYAQWNVNTFPVTYNANSGTGSIVAGAKSYFTDLTLSDGNGFTRTGYTQTGWNTASNGGGTAYALSGVYTMNTVVILYAQWTLTTYAVTYDSNAGSGGVAAGSKTYGVTMTLASGVGLIRTGYTYTGWNTVANGSGSAYAAGATYTANAAVTLYAQWSLNTYLVTYQANGATGSIVPGNKSYFTDLMLPDGSGFINVGFTFAGWNKAADGSGTAYASGAAYTTNAAVTLYAQWSLPPRALPIELSLAPSQTATIRLIALSSAVSPQAVILGSPGAGTLGALTGTTVTFTAPATEGQWSFPYRIDENGVQSAPAQVRLVVSSQHELRLAATTTTIPSEARVVTLFRATRKAGDPARRFDDIPITDLRADEVAVTEDGTAVSSTESFALFNPSPTNFRHVSLLALDLSPSLADTDVEGLVNAAKTYVDQTMTDGTREVAIATFTGTMTLRQDYSTNKAVVLAALDAIPSLARSGFTTNLYGVINDANTNLNARRGLLGNGTGIATSGTLVVFTDGADTAGVGTRTSALDAVQAETDGENGNAVFAVGLGSAIDMAFMTDLGNSGAGFEPAGSVNDLTPAFERIAQQASRLAGGYYRLEYRTPKLAGTHTLGVTVARLGASLTTSFSATGMGAGTGITGPSLLFPGSAKVTAPVTVQWMVPAIYDDASFMHRLRVKVDGTTMLPSQLVQTVNAYQVAAGTYQAIYTPTVSGTSIQAMVHYQPLNGGTPIQVLTSSITTISVNATAAANQVPSAVVDSNTAMNVVRENAAMGSTVGFTASATDPEAGVLTYLLVNSAGGSFAIHGSTGVLTLARPLHLDAGARRTVQVCARDSLGGIGPVSTVVIQVLDADLPPTIPADADPSLNQVAVTAGVGTGIGLTVQSVDPNNAVVTYSLVTNPGGRFAINPTTGVVSVAGALSPAGVYDIITAASDGTTTVTARFPITVIALSTYAVTYLGNGNSAGSVPTPEVKIKGVNLTLAGNTGNLIKPGYTFAGWNSSPDGSGTSYEIGATYGTDAVLDLYAQWSLNTYRVTYNTNSGMGAIQSGTKSYFSDLTLSDGNGFTRTGYTFTGWNTAADGSGTAYASGSLYSGNAPLTLYAQWGLNGIISYDTNGGNGIIDPVSKINGIPLILSDGSGIYRGSYLFTGWNTAIDGSGTAYFGGETYSANASATLYAQWIPLGTLTFAANGGTGSIMGQQGGAGISLSLPNGSGFPNDPGFTRTGYTFANWNTIDNGSGTALIPGQTYSVNAGLTILYAQWFPITYAVTYNSNGGIGSIVADNKIGDTALTLSSGNGFTRVGYNLTGWNTLADGTGTTYGIGGSYNGFESVALYAQWAVSYAVTYVGNGNTGGTVPFPNLKTQGVALVLAGNTGNLTRSGYTFTGWNTSPDGTGISYPVGVSYTVEAALTLYAQWVNPVEAFVTRFYQQCLSRQPDAGGLASWTGALNNKTQSGADVARGFVLSQEFSNRNLSDSAFLDVLYQSFFNRTADAGGKANWQAQLSAGVLREDVLYGFIGAQEFTNLCNSFGITQDSAAGQQRLQVRQFVRRNYQQYLGREPDAGGINYWVQALLDGSKTGGDVSKGFGTSQEFINKGTDDSTFLDLTYKAFFDRVADTGGKNNWLNLLAQGKTRGEIIDGFIMAQEFSNLCAKYGIVPFKVSG